MGFLYLAIAFITNAVANVLLKVGADKGVTLDWSLGLPKLLSLHSYLILGVALFAINVLFYIAALRMLPLSVAYPVMVGMSFIIANATAFIFLQEGISWQQVIGYALILGGITLVVSYAR